jgi:hypothetical protein
MTHLNIRHIVTLRLLQQPIIWVNAYARSYCGDISKAVFAKTRWGAQLEVNRVIEGGVDAKVIAELVLRNCYGANVNSWINTANSPLTERLCRRQMRLIRSIDKV